MDSQSPGPLGRGIKYVEEVGPEGAGQVRRRYLSSAGPPGLKDRSVNIHALTDLGFEYRPFGPETSEPTVKTQPNYTSLLCLGAEQPVKRYPTPTTVSMQLPQSPSFCRNRRM